ncbi:TPA: hypothetical protein ACH3X1_005734 [Trebouxia sp. C0004]
MHPQTAAWLKDLDFTDSDEEPPLHPSVFAEDRDTNTCSAEGLSTCTSQHHGQSLASLPAEVLLFIIDHLELPALACLIQTCTDLRAICMTDSVWENLCNGDFPKTCAQSQQYHKPRLSTHTAIRPSVSQPCVAITLTAIDDTVQTPTATPDSHPEASSCSHSQRYSFFDSNLRLRYSGGLVVEPAWLSLLPKVSCQGAGWLYLKGKTLSESSLKGCSSAFRHTHHHVRSKLHSLWLMGEVDDNLLLQRTLLKLTRLSWSKTYETLSNAFVYVCDCIALDLKTDHVNHVIHGLPKAAAEGKSQSLWQAVLQLWQDYRTWLTRVCSLCTRLMECISAERAAEMMSRGKADTPTLFDMGKAAFRSQVVLAFGLRSALQSSWQGLGSSAKSNTQCVGDAHILLNVTHLLQELDVSDDGTKPSGCHTQECMQEVFGLGEYRHEHARNLLQLKLCSRREHWATVKKPVI